MVGEVLQSSVPTFRGARPLNPGRDLNAVTRLLSQAFRDELDWPLLRVPVLRDFANLLWSASLGPALPGGLSGYVWEEEGQIIGNVTLTPDEGRPGTWMISNVAVEQAHRRQGIARALMQATLEEARGRRAFRVILQVRPHNSGAIRLYEELGFTTVDTLMYYRAAGMPPVQVGAKEPLPIRLLRPNEFRAAHRLAGEALSAQVRLLRPPRASDFATTWDDRLTEQVLDFFTGQQTRRWGYFAFASGADVSSIAGAPDGPLQAVVAVRAQRLGTPHAFEVYVRPEARGHGLEDRVVAFALNQLRGFPRRPIQTQLWMGHTELVQALERAGLRAGKGLTLMAKEMGG